MNEKKTTVNFLDLGSHLGQEIDIMLRECSKQGLDLNTYGVEANPNHYEQLLKKYKHKEKIKIYNLAIGSGSEPIKLYLDNHPSGKGHWGSSIYVDKASGGLSEARFVKVKQQLFSEWFHSLNLKSGINILKANIEGAEYDLVKDMDKHSMFSQIDIFCSSQEDSMVRDMNKIPSLRPKIEEVNSILSKNKIKIYELCGMGDGVDRAFSSNISKLLKTLS